MTLNTVLRNIACSAALLVAAPLASAHSLWILPGDFNISGDSDKWVTVDVSASNTIFKADKPIDLKGLTVTAPDGTTTPLASFTKGKRRSVFDLELPAQGSWKLQMQSGPRYMTFYADAEGKHHRLFMDKQKAQAKLPKGATEVMSWVGHRNTLTYITRGAPTAEVLQPQGKGLELSFATHPNDIVAGEAVQMTLLFNGKPAPKMELELTADGTRYRDNRAVLALHTDSKGQFSFTPAQAGRYMLSADKEQDSTNDRADKMGWSLLLTFEAQLP